MDQCYTTRRHRCLFSTAGNNTAPKCLAHLVQHFMVTIRTYIPYWNFILVNYYWPILSCPLCKVSSQSCSVSNDGLFPFHYNLISLPRRSWKVSNISIKGALSDDILPYSKKTRVNEPNFEEPVSLRFPFRPPSRKNLFEPEILNRFLPYNSLKS